MESNNVHYVQVGEDSSPKLERFQKVSVIPLVFLIFYEVSGGPFGVEDSVMAAGPLLALIGFLFFPFIWSIPEALITAEMGTMFPENGGYVVWVASALGPHWGFQQGWMKWLSGVIDNALYPVLFLDYLKSAIPALEGGFPRVVAVLLLTTALTYMNYRGLTIVGWVAIVLGVFSLVPFALMGLIAIPRLKPWRWCMVDLKNVNWGLYLNTLFWNLNYWDSISTLVGEVEDPGKTLPRALFYALILVVFAYFFPLLIGTGAAPVHRELWSDGYFSVIAKLIGGVWLRTWIQGASAVSNMGMFIAEMSSDSFQLLGMAERGMLPEIFARRSQYGTPLVGILFSASGVILLSWLSFQEIVAAENFLYCFAMIMEFTAFVKLRMQYPEAIRPYKVAERALYVWNNEQFVRMVSSSLEDVFPVIVEGMEKNLKLHWSKSVKQLTENVKVMLEQMDPNLYSKCLEATEIRESAARQEEMKRKEKWRRIETLAAAKKQNQFLQPQQYIRVPH